MMIIYFSCRNSIDPDFYLEGEVVNGHLPDPKDCLCDLLYTLDLRCHDDQSQGLGHVIRIDQSRDQKLFGSLKPSWLVDKKMVVEC